MGSGTRFSWNFSGQCYMVTMLHWSTDSLSGLDKNTFERNSTLLEKRKQTDAFSFHADRKVV